MEVFADSALVAVESAREVADGLDFVSATFEVADEVEAALGEDVAAVLSTENENVRVALGVQVGGELVLPQNSLGDAASGPLPVSASGRDIPLPTTSTAIGLAVS
jgi:hypothetical protein